jgi:GNAT superfamily N-acetyltransferase
MNQKITSSIVSTEGVRFSIQIDDTEVGHAYVYFIKNENKAALVGIMEDVFVEEYSRGKGVGTELVRLVVNEAKKRGCYKLIGTSRYTRPDVHDWYIKLGFKDYGKEFRMDL